MRHRSDDMPAIVHTGAAGVDGIRTDTVPVPEAGPGQVLVAVNYAGLNRHELFTAMRRTGSEPPLVIGADAFGKVVARGEGVSRIANGETVVLNPTTNWEKKHDIPNHPAILGSASPGTFARYVAVPENNVFPAPPHLTEIEAGAFGLAAVTAYRALFTVGDITAGEHVLITGVGGGVALLALDFALSAGAEVTVTSRSETKRAFALDRGAHHAIDSSAVKNADGKPFDLVVDSLGAGSVTQALTKLAPGGRAVTFGATTGGDIELSLRDIFFRQHRILGTSVGSGEEFAMMLEHVGRAEIRPVIDSVHPLGQGPEVIRHSAKGDAIGKYVFKIGGEFK